MKRSVRAAKLKSKKDTSQPDSGPNLKKGGLFSLPRWVFLALCLLLTFGGTWAVFELVVWNKVPPELVGKWVVTEGPDEGGTIDFYRGGTMIAKVNLDGKLGVIDAKVQVEGKKIIATLTNKFTGEQGTRIQTIKVLDSKRLVLEDERGMQIKLERAE
jgi:uncharacterized protein (TIGR03066 family)